MPAQSKSKANKSHPKPKVNPVIWVEIPVTNMKRAKTFYAKTFGLTYQMVDMHGYKLALFPMAMGVVGTGGALVYGPTYTPSYEGTIIYFSSKDIEASLKKVAQSGGKVIQNEKSIGEYGHVAYFEDSEGNRIALHSMK
jgi:uncharacterized protein